MFKAFNEAFIKELLEIKSSFYKIGLLTLFPLLAFGLIVAIFYKGVAYEMPVVAVDLDKSELSRDILFSIDASSTIDIKYRVETPKEAADLLKASKAYALIIVPKGFAKDTQLLKQPKITFMLNTQYILVGKILKAAFVKSLNTMAASFDEVRSLKNGDPIELQITPYFNTSKNYFYFLVSALLPSIWQIFIVIAVIVSFGTLFKAKKEQEFFKGGHISMKIFGKLLPYTVVYMFLGFGFLYYLYFYLGWEFQGSFGFLIFGMFLTLLAYEAVALTLFVTGFDYARSLSLGAVYTAPAFAFLGITFPASNMNSLALFWRDMLPISKYMELQISQANYGAAMIDDVSKLFYISLFSLLFIPVVIRFKQRLKV